MYVQYGLILILSLLLSGLLIYHLNYRKQQQQQTQITELLLALQSFPVHLHTMQQMLERSLALISAIPALPFTPSAVILLSQPGHKPIFAQRGLNDAHIALWKQLAIDAVEHTIDTIQFRPASQQPQNLPACFIAPLKNHDALMGVIILPIPDALKTSQALFPSVQKIAQAISTLARRKQVADELVLGNKVIDINQQAIFITDPQHQIIRCNAACCILTGQSLDRLHAANFLALPFSSPSGLTLDDILCHVDTHKNWQGEMSIQHDEEQKTYWLSLSAIRNSNDETTHYLSIFTDLTEIKRAEQTCQQLTYFDSLTGLPNRVLLHNKIQRAIEQAQTQNQRFALLCLDIDHFKKVNESLGHDAGDTFLKALAKRIGHVLHDEELLRTGGDEFVIIIPGLSADNHSRVLEVTRKILSCLQRPVAVDDYEFIVTGSIGISIYPNDAADANDLIKFAESAMFQAKKNGRNNYQWHNKRFTFQNFKYIQYESALRKAIKQQHLSTYLQPQTDLKSGRIIGAETLLRIHRGALADMSPGEYIPVAEESGLVVDIGDWVFRTVCQKVSAWHQQRRIPDDFHAIAVNISPIEFNRPDFIEKIRHTLHETGAPAHLIELELTESALQFPSDELHYKLTTLKDLGLSVAIDDFGTGYSSLSRLKNLPIDVLKIDRSFVHDIYMTGSSNQAIVEAVINMARALNIKTLAEGIENEAQVRQLQLLHCQYGQGYWFGKPMPTEQFASSALLDTSLSTSFNS